MSKKLVGMYDARTGEKVPDNKALAQVLAQRDEALARIAELETHRNWITPRLKDVDRWIEEIAVGEALIAWATSPERIISDENGYWCELCYGGGTDTRRAVPHADDCLRERALALGGAADEPR